MYLEWSLIGTVRYGCTWRGPLQALLGRNLPGEIPALALPGRDIPGEVPYWHCHVVMYLEMSLTGTAI